jgi:disulfide bond formation protein DsbB
MISVDDASVRDGGVSVRVSAVLDAWAPYVALVVAWTATIGSLYFSEVRHWVPCEWCWYQRIMMYPLAILIPIGILRRDAALPAYTVPLTLIGGAASTYHILLQKTDWFTGVGACQAGVPCSSDYLNWLGFVTIPMLALAAFVLNFFTMSAARHDAGLTWAADGDRPWAPVVGAIGAGAGLVAIGHLLRVLASN